MGRRAPWDDIPDATVLPGGTYQFAIESVEETISSTGKLMYNGTFNVVEPKAFAGLNHWESYVIGSDTDPNAEDPDTWKASIGARNLKRMLNKAQVPLSDDMEAVCVEAAGHQFVSLVTQETDDGSRDPRYKGRVRSRIQGYYGLGDQAPTVEQPAPARVTAGAPTVPPKKRVPSPAPPQQAVAPPPPSNPALRRRRVRSCGA